MIGAIAIAVLEYAPLRVVRRLAARQVLIPTYGVLELATEFGWSPPVDWAGCAGQPRGGMVDPNPR